LKAYKFKLGHIRLCGRGFVDPEAGRGEACTFGGGQHLAGKSHIFPSYENKAPKTKTEARSTNIEVLKYFANCYSTIVLASWQVDFHPKRCPGSLLST